MSRLKRLIREAHERSLWQALVVYLGVSYAILEAVQLFRDEFGLPDWLLPVALVLLLIGLPLVVVTSLAKKEVYGDEVPEEHAEAAAAEDRRLQLLTWRNAGASLVGALAVWGVVLTGWVLFGGRIAGSGVEAEAVDPANRVLVLPFTYRGSEEFAYFGEAMVDMLSKTLDGAGDLRTVNPQAVLGVLGQVNVAEKTDPGRAVAERLNVGNYVVGNVVEAGGRLQITARLHQTVDVAVEPVQASVQGAPDDVYALVNDLTARLLVSEENLGSLVRIEALTTDSLEALKAYLAGERFIRAGTSADRDSAYRAYERAVEIDSSFALAYYRLSQYAYFSGQPTSRITVESAEAAARHAGGLPWRERRLIEANAAYVRGAAGESQRLYNEILSRYPDDAEAWFGLQVLLGEYLGVLGLPPSAARLATERTLLYEPQDDMSLWGLGYLEAEEGNWQAFDSVTRLRFGDRKPYMYWRAIRAFGTDDVVEQERLLAEAESASYSSVEFMRGIVSFIACNPRGALKILAINERRNDSPLSEAYHNIVAAEHELGLGHRRAAQERISRLGQLRPEWAMVHHALYALAPHMPGERAELEAWRDSLERWDVTSVVDPVAPEPYWAGFAARFAGIHAHLRHYLLGRFSARLGDYQAALHHADELERVPVPPDCGSLNLDLAQSVRAHVLAEQGRFREALRALEAAPRVVPYSRRWQPLFLQAQERFLRAELLAELGRDEEALRWFQSVGYYSDPVMAGPSHLRQAQIHERLGQPEQAALQYRRLIELWSDCDAEFRPMVEAAENALERLAGESSAQ